MEELEEILMVSLKVKEVMLHNSIREYNETGDFEQFKDCLVASLSPATFKCLEIATVECTNSLKEYHIVMSFLDKLNEIAQEKVEEVDKLFNPIVLEED